MPKKRYIEELVPDADYYDDYSFEGPIVDTLKKLSKSLQKAYDLGYSKVYIKTTYGYDDSSDYALYGSRPETELEITKRLAKARRAKETKAKNKIKNEERAAVDRRKLYVELKEEFGDERF